MKSTSTHPFDDSSSIEKLESEFQKVLESFSGEGHLEHFREEYEKLLQCVIESVANENKLKEKVIQLKEKISENAGKVKEVMEMSNQDQDTIYNFKQETQKAWKLIEELHNKEQISKKTIKKLTSDLTELSKLVDQGMGIEKEKQKKQIIKLVKEKEKLLKENVDKKKRMQEIQEKIKEKDEELREARMKRNEFSNEKKNVVESVLQKVNALKRVKENKEKAVKTLEIKVNLLKKRNEVISNLSMELNGLNELLETRKLSLGDESKKLHSLKNQHFTTTIAIDSLKLNNSEKYEANIKMDFENKKLLAQLKSKKRELNSLQNKLSKAKDLKESELLKLEKIKKSCRDHEGDIVRIDNTILDIEKEIESIKSKTVEVREEVKRVEYQKNVISKRIVLLRKRNGDLEEVKNEFQNQSNSIKNNLMVQTEFTESQKKYIKDLKKVREKQSDKTISIRSQYKKALEEKKMKELENNELQKLLGESKQVLTDASTRYEAVRREKNQCSKQFTDCQEQIFELKKKYSLMNKQIKHLREEIVVCEKLKEDGNKKIVKTDRGIEKEKKEKDKKNEELKKLLIEIQNVKVKLKKLNESIFASDQDRKKKLKILKELTNQRDVLGTQLVRRNDELALLHEKLRIQDKFLDNGRVVTGKKKEDTRLLKLLIMQHQRSLFINSSNMTKLKEKEETIFNLMKDLKHSRLQVAGLSQILEDPKNKGRCRSLEGTGNDFTTFDIYNKTQKLQNRMIKKTEERVEIEMAISKQEKLKVQLVEIMKRHPTNKELYKLNELQKKLRQLTGSMKSMASELNFLTCSRREKEFEVERLKRLSSEIQKEYLRVRSK